MKKKVLIASVSILLIVVVGLIVFRGLTNAHGSQLPADRSNLIINKSYRDAQSLVYQLPDDEGRADAVRYIGKVHDLLFSRLHIRLETIDATKLDDSALKTKLKGDFILFTTIGSRLFNAATQPLNIGIEGSTLHWGDQTAPVSDLRIILVGKNPYGDGHCVVHAAGSNRLLVGVGNGVYGQCSYHIAQGDKLLKEGFYNEKFVLSNPILLPRQPKTKANWLVFFSKNVASVQNVAFVLIGALVYGLCCIFRLKPVYPKIARPKRSALCSLASVSASMLIILVIMLMNHKHGPTHGMDHKQQRHLVDQMFLLLIYFLPMALMLRLNGETLKSVGLTRANLWKATVVGLFLAATTLFFGRGGPGAVFKFTESHNAHSLIYFSFVGFGEEILFRGYLQNRLVAWVGHYQGWILASVIMALVHLPQRVFIQGLDFPHALASSLGLIPVSLLMGFVMLRTGSVVPGGLFHTFANWVGSR